MLGPPMGFVRWLERFRPKRWVDLTPPSLPLLRFTRESEPADWLRASLRTFGADVASFLPGHFETYLRIHHPFGSGIDGDADQESWAEVNGAPLAEITDAAEAERLAYRGGRYGQAIFGRMPPRLPEVLIEHLRPATSTPHQCFFALWDGHGDSPVPRRLEPSLQLPYRDYHLFAGPIEGAAVDLAGDSILFPLCPNLWWPADHAWCVATEIDFAWTYVGGSRACVDALLGDPRIEGVETHASARW